jgi:cytochrome P450
VTRKRGVNASGRRKLLPAGWAAACLDVPYPRRLEEIMSGIAYDPFDPAVLADPYPHYAALRRSGAVHAVPSLGMKVVCRYAEAESVLRSPEMFSSSPYQDFIRAAMELGAARVAVARETLLGSDPPVHTRLRKLVKRGFTQARIQALGPAVERLAKELVANLSSAGEGDFVSMVAGPLPVMVIATILGVEPERHRDFKRWSDHILLATTGVLGDDERRGLVRSFEEMDAYIDEMVARRRRRPTDDLISTLIRAERGEEVMGPEEVRTFVPLLLIAGNEATTHLIANIGLALTSHRDLLERVRERPGLAANVVEETLRYDAPVQMVLRRASKRAEIGGTWVAEGDVLGVLIGAANRDDRQFPGAERFDPDRDVGSHLTFGAGNHFCLGAGLARMEACIALLALADAIDSFERVQDGIEYPASFLVRGPKSFRVRVSPARRARALRA